MWNSKLGQQEIEGRMTGCSTGSIQYTKIGKLNEVINWSHYDRRNRNIWGFTLLPNLIYLQKKVNAFSDHSHEDVFSKEGPYKVYRG